MEGIRAWSVSLCMAALGCAAVRLLVPKNGNGKVFHLITATFFLCCMLMPLLRVQSVTPLDIHGLPEEVKADLLEDVVTRQLQAQVESTVTALAEEGLAARNVTAKKITVITDITAEGIIYIQQVTITVDKQTVSIARAVGEVLEQQLQTTVLVEAQ